MSRRTLHSRLATVSLLVLAAACDRGSDPVGPAGADASAINADVAAATGANIASDIAVWAGNEAAASTSFGRTDAPAPGTCTRNGTTTNCTGGREGTLNVVRSVKFFDAAGAAQQQYDATTTARIEFGVQVTGSVTTPEFNSTMERARSSTVSGLAGAETERTWNGTGTSTTHSVFTGDRGTRTHDLVESDTTTNVVWVVAPTRGAYPASGTIVRRVAVSSTITGDRTASYTALRRVQVTFNGTAQVPLVVSAVTRRGTTIEATCQLNLATRRVVCGE